MSGKLTFYPLINHNIFAVKRHLEVSKIPLDQVMFVINTLDKEFEKEAIEYLESVNAPYTVTESNGTAARGKNCFLEVFESSDSDYAVLIDGDDFLTPHGVAMYQMLAEGEMAAPDAICLYNQFTLLPEDIDCMNITGEIPEDSSNYNNFFTISNWDDLVSGKYIKEILGEDEENLISTYTEVMSMVRHTVEENETHCRVTFISKKAAKYKFNENFIVGEDTLNYFDLKNAAMRGELFMVRTNEASPSYVYDMRLSSIAIPCSKDKDNYLSWADLYLEKLKEYEREQKLHKINLPDLLMDYPKGYKATYFSDYSFKIRMDIPATNGSVVKGFSEVPSNASEKTILENMVVEL